MSTKLKKIRLQKRKRESERKGERDKEKGKKGENFIHELIDKNKIKFQIDGINI